MENNGIHFSYQAFNSVFPFFLQLDQDLKIVNRGQSIHKLFPNIQYQFFHEQFQIVRPHINNHASYDELLLQGKGVVMIKKENYFFRGQFQELEDQKSILFVGAPWFSRPDELTDAGLSISDFAHHNPTLEFLQLLQTEEISNKELKELLNKVS